MPNESLSLQGHRDLFDNYKHSVLGLYAFAQSACWDGAARSIRNGSCYGIPRKMTHPGEGEKPATRIVTPDAVVQASPAGGIVAEMKKHFPATVPVQPFEQIKKQYDAPLLGWWTSDESIPNHDLVLLTHVMSSVNAVDAYREWCKAGNSFSRSFAIVEFGLMQTGQLWFMLRRVEGSLSDAAHDEALRRSKNIPPDVMLDLFKRYKFMDSEPPLMYMLVTVFNYILPLFRTEEEFERASGGRHPTVEVTATQVRNKLEEQFCPPKVDSRQFTLPRIDWVHRTLEAFVRIGIATRIPGPPRKYRISLKKPRVRDVMEYFAAKLLKAEEKERKKAAPPAQGDLFSSSTDRGATGTSQR